MLKTETIAHIELWERLDEHQDQEARRDLVELYARVVKYVAGRMSIGLPHYVDHKDLISAGLLGLIQAIDNYDYRRGNKFETYAIPRIRGAILDELRSQDWFPRSLRRKARQLEDAFIRLEARHGRTPTDEEIALELGVSRAELAQMMDEVAVATIVSLDADSSDDDSGGSNLGDYIPDTRTPDAETCVSEEEMRGLISGSLGELTDKEQLVLVLYYYEELTLKEIGEILDVTESRVCQIHTKAILRLRAKIQRRDGRKSLNRLTREIREQRAEEETGARKRDLAEKINIMAGLVLLPMTKLASILLDMDVPLSG